MKEPQESADDARGTEGLDLGASGYRVVTIKKCKLSVVEGPDAGKEVVLDSPKIRIGKDASCDLQLSDTAVSRQHAVVERKREGYMLRDTGSRNGTFLNDIRVNDAFVPPGARIKLGRTVLRLQPRDEDLLVTPNTSGDFHGVLARSQKMREILGVVERVAATDVSVIVTGETGTGKEVVARSIHAASPRASGPYIVIDCGNVNQDLVGSELFGHEPGAFTGATQRRIGAFEQACGGTLFLDEIGELRLDLQPRLLRVLEQREIVRLGTNTPVKIDVRVLAATHRELEQMVAEGKFREDLYYRLSQVELRLPPLRERPEDVAVLAQRFLEATLARNPARAGLTLSKEAVAILEKSPWKGNVRELRNVIERAVAMAPGPAIGPADLLLRDRPAPSNEGLANRSLEDIEKEAIRQTLRAHNGNKTRAAAVLGIATITLREKMKRYGLKDDE